ncbi:RICIN domain-containing protein [Streptomyces sp. G45]|uniref:RICIN domain-containing protein n=1 Tax=Streptomyces sp. G45 TaxID=3406627 RepID=UPI003C201DD4
MTALLAAPSQAAAEPPRTAALWSTWENQHYANQCLDGSVSQGVRLNTCNGGNYQTWTYFHGYSDQIQHSQSGRCLDGSVSQGVRLVACNGGTYQKWYPDSSTHEIRHGQSGRCLDGSISQGVRLVVCNGGTYQKWN